MRKNLVLSVLTLLALLLAACGSPAPADAPAEAPAAEASQPEASSAQPAAPAAAPGEYNEAPQLAELVAAGELPPVAERMPEEPLVITPLNEIGQYGGEQRGAAFGPQIGQLDTEALRMQSLLFIEPDLVTLTPNILLNYEHSEDFRTWTLHLRAGMKWSDGEPFTADDFMFWYEDILLNTDLTPAVPVVYISGDEPMTMTMVDDVTIQVDFLEPNPNFDLTMSKSHANDRMYAPRHYLEQWHINYNEDAEELASSVAGVIRDHRQHIDNFHMKDFAEGEWRVLGHGAIDFDSIFRAIHEIGYEGWLCADEESGGDLMAGMKECYDFLQRPTIKA